MWLLVLIGQEHGWENQRVPSPWKIIATALFKPTNDLQTIYLSWLSVSPMKADFDKWNTKPEKPCHKHLVRGKV
jgi:hypothetical protein